MNKRERVMAVLEGRKPDGIPSSFSLHFPTHANHGQEGIKAHLDFFSETDVDIIKIMNENLTPSVSGISRPEDWKRIPSFSRNSPFIVAQADFVKRIRDSYEEDAPCLCTIHGICASTVHPMRPQYQDLYEIRNIQLAHYRKDPTVYLDATKRIAEAQCYMVEKVIEAGADGIYFAALGGEKHLYSDEEFATVVKPYDLQIMKTCKDMGKIVVLHMCKKNLDMLRFKDYAPYCDIVNWGIYENDISLEQGMEIFPNKTIMGGLANRSGVLVEGSEQALVEAVHHLTKKMEGKKFILGADCTLPTDISPDRIRTAVMAARKSK
ncbi:MAG: uroporphyrinogen decarboxylase family protein [Sphaerochaetaceae bacterium]|jgi:uroporphyrinogen decarboxylase